MAGALVGLLTASIAARLWAVEFGGDVANLPYYVLQGVPGPASPGPPPPGESAFQPAPGGPQAVAAPHSGASGGATDEPKKDDSAEKKDEAKDGKEGQEQNFNFHAQTTITSQGDPGFPAQ
jgi:hypothetical protein